MLLRLHKPGVLSKIAVSAATLLQIHAVRIALLSPVQMERNMLRIYFGWEVVNLFLGGVMASSLVR